jgi:hypothetical protein
VSGLLRYEKLCQQTLLRHFSAHLIFLTTFLTTNSSFSPSFFSFQPMSNNAVASASAPPSAVRIAVAPAAALHVRSTTSTTSTTVSNLTHLTTHPSAASPFFHYA